MSRSGAVLERLWWVICAAILLVSFIGLTSCDGVAIALAPAPTAMPAPDTGNVTVVVKDQKGEELRRGVVVRVTNSTEADDYDNKVFRLNCSPGEYVTAWAPNYKVAFKSCDAIGSHGEIMLQSLNMNNTVGNSWMAANITCIGCHRGQIQEGLFWEYNEWSVSGHATTLTDRFLETMYNGTNWSGSASRETVWTINSSGRVRVRPEDTSPNVYFGPGYRLDYPNEYGNCAYCHAPAAVSALRADVDLRSLFSSGMPAQVEGVTCDVCHKVIGVTLDDNGFPYEDQPGILSLELLPPQAESDFTVGPFSTTSTRNGPQKHFTCSPIFSKSEFCAACHYGKFHGTVIYNSYGEWKESPYGKRLLTGEGEQKGENPAFRSCQDCHMSSESEIAGTLPSDRDACSTAKRKPGSFDHNVMLFGQNLKNLTEQVPRLIQDAAVLDVASEYLADSDLLRITVNVTNTKAGHKFPTDSPLRHLILLVQVLDEQNNPAPQVGGDIIPVWGGVGTNKPFGMEAYGGMPGRIFAHVLVDRDTNESPTAAYWNPTKLALDDGANKLSSDTRLKPLEPNESQYSFAIPSSGEVFVSVKLMYRYAFFDLALQKNWTRPDIEVVAKECLVDFSQSGTLDCE